MAIDKGDWHYDDAGSWEAACRHIGVFLLWAMERGLAGPDHTDLEAARADPAGYVIRHCDTKLWDEDFSDEGARFAESRYSLYLEELGRYAADLDIDAYQLPLTELKRDHFFAFLDKQLEAWR
jgi:hypothetical protein